MTKKESSKPARQKNVSSFRIAGCVLNQPDEMPVSKAAQKDRRRTSPIAALKKKK